MWISQFPTMNGKWKRLFRNGWIISICSPSVEFSRLFAISWTAARQDSLSITNFQSLLKLMSIELVMPSNQPSHPLSSPSPPPFNLSQHQGIFQWVSSLHGVAKVLELQLQSFQWIFRADFPEAWPVGSPCSFKGLSRVFSNITVRKHQFFGAQLSLWSNSHIHTWLLEKP